MACGPDFKLGLPLSDISEADWDATYEVNVKGVFLLCRAALSGMVENSGVSSRESRSNVT